MNIPFTVLRTEMFGEEDWSIAVKKEHINSVPPGFKAEPFRLTSKEDMPYEFEYPYNEIRYFTPNDERLSEILCEISLGVLKHKFSCALGDVYEGDMGLKKAYQDVDKKRDRMERLRKVYKVNFSDGCDRDYLERETQILTEEGFSKSEIKYIFGNTNTTSLLTKGLNKFARKYERNKRKDYAKRMVSRGTPVADVAEYLGVSLKCVYQYIDEDDRAARKQSNIDRVLRLRESGNTYQEIAKAVNMSIGKVYEILRKSGGIGHKKCVSKKTVEDRIKLAKRATHLKTSTGKAWADIAAMLGVGKGKIEYAIRFYKTYQDDS